MSDYISREIILENVLGQLTKSTSILAMSECIKNLEAADVIEAPRWIPVTERLPEGEAIAFNALKGSYGYGEYLIGFVGEAKDIESDTGFLCENEMEILTSVTHWMPLPQPPERDGE